MKTIEEYYEYLKISADDLEALIGDNESEFNKGRLYIMNRILSDLKSWVDLNELEHKTLQKEDVVEIQL